MSLRRVVVNANECIGKGRRIVSDDILFAVVAGLGVRVE